MKYDDMDEERMPLEKPMDESRNPWKIIILTILTLGIYGIIFYIKTSFEVQKLQGDHETDKLMNFLAAYLLSYFTFFIVMNIWQYQLTDHVSEEMSRRGITYNFDTGTFWGWYIFGSFILIGPFVYIFKLIKALNLLCADYNAKELNASCERR